MKIHPGDWERYGAGYKLTRQFKIYAFCFDVPNNRGAAEKAFRAFYRRLKYAIDNSELNVVGITGLSCHHHDSYLKFTKTGGRPQKTVQGKSTKYHVHTYLALPAQETGLSYFVKKLIAKQDQRQAEAGLPKTRKWKSVNSEDRTLYCMPVGYVKQQSDICFRIGDISPFE